jgi:hypothetical protein
MLSKFWAQMALQSRPTTTASIWEIQSSILYMRSLIDGTQLCLSMSPTA